MPKFKTVGYIDDSLSREEVMREYRRRYSLSSYHRRRAEVVTELGGKCAECSSKIGLTFVKKKGKNAPPFRVGQLGNMNEKRRKKLLKYVEVLCSEHAKARLYSKGQITHGTWYSAYKKKCRCDECGEYMADYNLRRREDRRRKRYGE